MQTLLRNAMQAIPAARHWRLIPGLRLARLGRCIEAVLVTHAAVLAFAPDRASAEAAAVDLADFHGGCGDVPVLPVALAQGVQAVAQRPLLLPGAAPAIACTRLQLRGLLDWMAQRPPLPGFDPASWEHAAYRPVPALMAAAARLYADHDDARLLLANAGRGDLGRTRAAVLAALGRSRAANERAIVFVTGDPGAGKTLCGLDLAFAPDAGAAFLTGNPALLHVLRAALVRDAAHRGLSARAARQRVEAVVQPLHAFRDHYVRDAMPPPDRLLVIDEAQRCWTRAYATRKTQNRAVTLTDSEPGCLLDIMARPEGWSAIVCLLGGGQEIHAGEGGLAAWGEALASRPAWRPAAPPGARTAADPRQRLPDLPSLELDEALHLGRPVRAHRAPQLVAWVDAVLANDPAAARIIAAAKPPVRLTRSLDALRTAVRGRPGQRYGLLASAGGRRLRAEGLGGLLLHQDEDAVAQWFLNAWPDIRSADALEVAATEFGAQGLELDHAGLCWDLDLARTPDNDAWQPRAFRATAWTTQRSIESLSNKRNAYRVLLTRARQTTTIWVPRGNPRDPTRNPAHYEAVAEFLRKCGAAPLDETPTAQQDAPMPEPTLL